MKREFLPVSKKDMNARGWDEVDIVLVNGDAYVDHPAFGAAVVGRQLEAAGYRVGIISMPDVTTAESMKVLGRPRLFFAITSGNVDSMVARYTAFKKVRNDDPYAPGGKAGHKPDRALIVYANLVKQAYKGVPLVIGGLEASMRRLVHYDYWSNKVRRSIIEDTRADLLIYGMADGQIEEAASRYVRGENLEGIPGTVVISKECPEEAIILQEESEVAKDKGALLQFYKSFYRHRNHLLAQPVNKRYLLHYPQNFSLAQERLEAVYRLPFLRRPHPVYQEEIPAFTMIRDSINAHRGCVSGCSFCSLGLHQGKRIVSRSKESVLAEVKEISRGKGFKGHITDVGGPSANMYGFTCKIDWKCSRESCTSPKLCKNLSLDASDWFSLLDEVVKEPGVKKVTVGSGIRYDVLMRSGNSKANLKKLVEHHISGQLKIAPEHLDPKVMQAMRKDPVFDLEEFIRIYSDINKKRGKKQYLIPYLMSCHPGCDLEKMKKLKRRVKDSFGFVPKQVQAFLPLPMTISSIIYYTGQDPITGEKYFVERDPNKRRKQNEVFFRD